MKLAKTLEIFTNVAILIVAVMLTVVIVRNHRVLFAKPYNQNEALGKTLVALPGVPWGNRDNTLIIALRDGCHFCEASLPFYRELAALANEGKTVPQISIVMPDETQIEESYLKKANLLSVPHVAGVPLKSVDVGGTPTLLLVDTSGKVQKEWVGQLSQSEEREVKASLMKR